MKKFPLSDEEIVENARRTVTGKRKLRWGMLIYAVFFLWMAGYVVQVIFRQICQNENPDTEQFALGFFSGLVLAVGVMFFGVPGGLCLGKFLTGFEKNFRREELLVQYHDRLRDLGRLPDRRNDERAATG